MEQEVVLLDTTVLIDFYRKKNKSKSVLYRLSKPDRIFAVSAITHFEIYAGVRNDQVNFWNNFFHDLLILPFNAEVSRLAATIEIELKSKRKQIGIPDLLIASTALLNNLKCATLNRKHFERVPGLKLIDLSE